MSRNQTAHAVQPVSEQQPEPDLTPRPNPIIAEPATVAACQAEYATAEDVRERLDEQIRGSH